MAGQSIDNPTLAEEIDLKKIIRRFAQAWKLFFLSVGAWLFIGVLFTISFPPVYEAQTAIEVQEPQRIDDPNRMVLGAQHFNEPDKYYFVNEQVKLSSFPLVMEAIQNLNLRIKYFRAGLFETELYRQTPFIVELEEDYPVSTLRGLSEIPFNVELVDANQYHLSASGEDELTGEVIEFESTIPYGKWVQCGAVRFRLQAAAESMPQDERYGFYLIDQEALAFDLMEDLKVQRAELDASVFTVNLQGSPAAKTKDIIAALSEAYVAAHVADKGVVVDKTIAHLDEELARVISTLSGTEVNLEKYKTGNGITSLGMAGSLLLEQSASLEKEKVNLEIRQSYYQYLREFLADEKNLEKIVSPQAFAIDDPFLTSLINGLAKLQMDKKVLIAEGKESHPAFDQILRKIDVHKTNILETVGGFETSNNIRITAMEAQVADLKRETAQIPVSEFELLRLQRSFELNEALYKNLMLKKMEAEISKAVLEADITILAPAYITSVDPVFPSLPIMLIIALLLGLLSPVAWILLRSLINQRIQKIEELNTIPNCPSVVFTFSRTSIHSPEDLLGYPESQTADQLRRVRMSLKIGDSARVVSIQSCRPGEGRSLLSTMLAASFASGGKKTLLITTEAVCGRENLSVSAADTLPPEAEELAKHLNHLRGEHDVIVVDAPPVQVSAQATAIANYADRNVLITRRKHTRYDDLHTLFTTTSADDIEFQCVVFNDALERKLSRQQEKKYYRNKPLPPLKRLGSALNIA